MTKKKLKYIVLFHACMWFIFSIVDLITEVIDEPFPEYPIICFTIVGLIAYVVLKILFDRNAKFLDILAEAGVFLGIGVAFAIVIMVMEETKMWPIRQKNGGWAHFLNGIEYLLYPIFYVPANTLGIFLYGCVAALIRVIKKK